MEKKSANDTWSDAVRRTQTSSTSTDVLDVTGTVGTLAFGTYRYDIFAEDAVGNKNSAKQEFVVDTDICKPSIEFLNPLAGADPTWSGTSFTATVTGVDMKMHWWKREQKNSDDTWGDVVSRQETRLPAEGTHTVAAPYREVGSAGWITVQVGDGFAALAGVSPGGYEFVLRYQADADGQWADIDGPTQVLRVHAATDCETPGADLLAAAAFLAQDESNVTPSINGATCSIWEPTHAQFVVPNTEDVRYFYQGQPLAAPGVCGTTKPTTGPTTEPTTQPTAGPKGCASGHRSVTNRLGVGVGFCSSVHWYPWGNACVDSGGLGCGRSRATASQAAPRQQSPGAISPAGSTWRDP